MTVLAVAFNGTRRNDSDSNTNWGNFVIGGGAPASEFPLAYQVTSGTTSGAVNKKINSTSARQGVDYVHGSGIDMTAAANRLWFCKIYVSDSFDLNATWGVEVAMGSSDTNNDHRYNIAGTGANLSAYDQYPAQGGYLITSIDPNIDTWREAENGTFNQASVLWWAVGAQFINGTAKTENVAMDSIDIGTGLTMTLGTGADPDGTFPDFVEADQNTKANRWGVVTGSGDVIRCHGLLTIGTATETDFTDNTSIVLFPDGYHSRGLVGIAIGNSNASSVINVGCTLIGEGTRNGVDANDTRPDYTVTGTSGAHNFTGEMRNFRDVTFQSACSVQGASIECMLLDQNSADIENCTITTRSLTNVACLQDPTFAASTDLNNTDFVQGEAGHAIQVLGTATLTNIGFSGYGGTPGSNLVASSGAADAAIFNNTGGAITLTIAGGDTPSVRNGAGATTTVINTVNVTFDKLRDNSEVRIYEAGTTTELDGIENATAGSADNRNFTASVQASTSVDYVIHNNNYEYIRVEGFTWPTADQTINIQQRLDRNYSNP